MIGNGSLTHKKLLGNFLPLNAIRQHTQNLLFGFCQFLYIDSIFFKVGGTIIYCFQNMQQRGYWGSLTITSHDADIIGLVQDSSSEDCWFSGGLTSKFEKPVVGVITKIDKDDSNPKRARSYLELAGCTTIFEVSSYTGEGVEALSQGFHDMVNKYREENKGRYADDYFD